MPGSRTLLELGFGGPGLLKGANREPTKAGAPRDEMHVYIRVKLPCREDLLRLEGHVRLQNF